MKVFVFFLLSFMVWQRGFAELSCENINDCHESVGQLRIRESNGQFKVCTGFLVKDNVVATNLHCLPDNLKQIGTSCSKVISFAFPENKLVLMSSDKAETNDCDKVVLITAPLFENGLNVDLALLKFERSFQRKVLRISQSGFPFQSKFQIYKIDPTEKGGVQKKITCLPKPKTLLNPYYVTEKSPIINLNPCVAIKGNSGSPILSEDGLVRGMLSSGGGFGLKKEMQEMNTVFGSNFSCVDLGILGYPSMNLSSCDLPINPENEKKLASELYAKENMKLMKLVEEKLQYEKRFKNSEMRLFNWSLISKEPVKENDHHHSTNTKGDYLVKEIIFKLAPKCVFFSGNPIGILRKKIKDSNLIGVSFELPEFIAKQKIGSQLDFSAEVIEKSLTYKVNIPVAEFFNENLIKFDVEIQNSLQTVQREKWELKACD